MLLRAHHKKTLRRISITPLADLVFILLVFFILETSFTEFRELAFNVPEEKQEATSSAGDSLNIQLFEGGQLWVQGAAIGLAALGDYLDDKQYGPDTAVALEVHQRVPLQLLVNAMDQLQRRKLEKICILPLDKKQVEERGG